MLNNICLLIRRTGFYLSIILETLRFVQITRHDDSSVSTSHDISDYHLSFEYNVAATIKGPDTIKIPPHGTPQALGPGAASRTTYSKGRLNVGGF